MNHVTQVVGGFLSQQKHIGQTGVRFTSVPKAQTGRSREVPARQCVSDAAVHGQAGHSSPDLADRCDRARANGAELGDEFPAADRANRSPDRTGSHRWAGGVYAGSIPGGCSHRNLERVEDAGSCRSILIAETRSAFISTRSTTVSTAAQSLPLKCALCSKANCELFEASSSPRFPRPPIAPRGCTWRIRAIPSTRFSILVPCALAEPRQRQAAEAGEALRTLFACWILRPDSITKTIRSCSARRILLAGLRDQVRTPQAAAATDRTPASAKTSDKFASDSFENPQNPENSPPVRGGQARLTANSRRA